jgi:TPR repeat protein
MKQLRICVVAFVIAIYPLASASAECTLEDIDRCIAESPDEAEQLIRQNLAVKPDATMAYKLGKLYREGAGTTQNLIAARSQFEEAAKAGEKWASLALADMLIKGEGGPRNPERAVEILTEISSTELAGPALSALGAYFRSEQASTGVAMSAVNLRAGPNVTAEKLRTLPQGAEVTIHECPNWCKVTYLGETGWSSAKYSLS